jgi:carboxymethylenebutenolidase
LNDKWIAVRALDGREFNAYTAKPAVAKAPAVVVVQEMFGVSKWLRSYVDALADAGYFGIAPDLYHRQQPGLDLSDQDQADFDKAMSLYKTLDASQAVEDLIATVNRVRSMPECTGKVATVGFCLGGKLAFLMAARGDAECNVGFYATGIHQLLSQRIAKPLLLHIAGEDSVVPPDAQAAIHNALDSHPLVTIYDYPGAGHAFMRTSGQHYDPAHAQKAAARTLEFLQNHLTASIHQS